MNCRITIAGNYEYHVYSKVGWLTISQSPHLMAHKRGKYLVKLVEKNALGLVLIRGVLERVLVLVWGRIAFME
jgi:hypothetical protein